MRSIKLLLCINMPKILFWSKVWLCGNLIKSCFSLENTFERSPFVKRAFFVAEVDKFWGFSWYALELWDWTRHLGFNSKQDCNFPTFLALFRHSKNKVKRGEKSRKNESKEKPNEVRRQKRKSSIIRWLPKKNCEEF